ncbi:hypothetical protein [uncultured Sphaerochaeta sp.]|uniref:hypothetical protein n=1 Tax=uncultured Sphaerochaeta sp. TaxID=886478 RepID=UPI002A0A4CB1|nr:hypothetical protein [uncultured Sphaerochaeta sp.]
MKRFLQVLLIMLCTQSFVFAMEVHSSNSIGQDLGPYEPSSSYSLHIEDTSSSLYKGADWLWTKTESLEGDKLTRSFSYPDTTHTLIQIYEDNQLMSETENELQYLFSYAKNGKLQKVTLLQNGELVSIEIFFYDEVTHQLNGSRTIGKGLVHLGYFGHDSKGTWFTDTLSDSFEKVTVLPNNLTIKEIWKGENKLSPMQVTNGEHGSLVLAQQGITETYDEQGLLVREETPSNHTEYQYNEQRMLTKERTVDKDGKVRETSYNEGVPVSQRVTKDNNLEKEIVFNADKTRVETLYDKGKAYCDITYASDGKRVLSIQYR